MEAHRNVSLTRLDSTSMTDHVTVALVVYSSSFAMAILAEIKVMAAAAIDISLFLLVLL